MTAITVFAEWRQEFQQVELRTTRPATGLTPAEDVFVGDLLGLVRNEWTKNKKLPTWLAMYAAPEGAKPEEYHSCGLPNQAAAMAVVEAKYRERNPSRVLRVHGSAVHIVKEAP